METTFAAVFPGLFLYSIDCTTILKQWAQNQRDKYIIRICELENWKDQQFHFSFLKGFIEKSYEGFQEKGEVELERAKLIRHIFTQECPGSLSCVGVASIKIDIPDDWDDDRKRLARKEAEFQYYHVVKTLFETLQEVEKMKQMEFKKFYTYLGEDGIKGLSRKFALAMKEHFEEDFEEGRLTLGLFQKQLGRMSWFPLRILSANKRKAFQCLMSHRSKFNKLRKDYVEKEFAFLFKRALSVESSMSLPLDTAEEGLTVYQRLIDGLDKIKDMFSFQLGISSTFFEVIGLTIAIGTLLFEIIPPLVSGVMIVILVSVYAYEINSLLSYSTGPMIIEELDYLISELHRS